MNISQGKRTVRKYISEFETLLGRMTTQDEATWLNAYIWGLQPHLARAVALKYPTTIAQAAGHAEATELAIRASQRPNFGGNSGGTRLACATSRGGSQTGAKKNFQGRGRMRAGSNQRGGRSMGMKRGGGFNHNGKQQQQNSQNRSVVQC